MKDDIKFLKELQNELKTQETDCQASPKFWVVGDYRMVPCPEGFEDEYYINAPNEDYHDEADAFLEAIKEKEFDNFPDEVIFEFKNIQDELDAIEWVRENYDEDATLIPVVEEHFIHKNTMFLTKESAKRHIELNRHHYSSRVHTYAMTAWRSPKVERLLRLLETFDWDRLAEHYKIYAK